LRSVCRLDSEGDADSQLCRLPLLARDRFWLWRAVDDEGEVLELLVQRRRDKNAAVKLTRKLLKKQGFAPDVLVTDKLRSYGAARAALGLKELT
jgi:putative transposase